MIHQPDCLLLEGFVARLQLRKLLAIVFLEGRKGLI